MLAIERRNKIEQMINENGSVLVVDLAKMFDVTTETIRGDLLKLEKQGVLVRTYGGATLAENNNADLGIMERESINSEAKRRIAECASKMIRDGETIFLDSSTTSWHLARCLKERKKLTVITNALKIITELADCQGINLICVGGRLNVKNMSHTGRVAQASIRDNYYANRCFFACRGITMQCGLVDASEEEAEVKLAMIENCSEVVFLCDHTKFGKVGQPKLIDFGKIDYMITDMQLSEDWKTYLESFDIHIKEV